MPSTLRPFIRLAVVVTATAGLAGCMSNSDGEAPDVALVKTMMKSIGAVDPNEKPIAYQPRAPLAMPSKTANLPAPEDASALPPNWPRDRDAELASIQSEADRAEAKSNRGFEQGGSNRIPIQRVKQGNRPGANAGPAAVSDDGNWERAHVRLTRDEMKGAKRIEHPDTTALLDANGEPQRRYLIEPPVEYSTPAATAALPDAKDLKKDKTPKKDTSFDNYDPVHDKPR